MDKTAERPAERRVIVAGRIVKEGGAQRMSAVTTAAGYGYDGFQRWGLASFDCRSARHLPCLECRIEKIF